MARGSLLVLLVLGLTAAIQAQDLRAGDVFLGSTGLLACNEPGTNPHRLCSVHQIRSKATAIKDTTSSDDVNWVSVKRGLSTLDSILQGGG